jgi:ParB-like chromosome segregation protein Spo0J
MSVRHATRRIGPTATVVMPSSISDTEVSLVLGVGVTDNFRTMQLSDIRPVDAAGTADEIERVEPPGVVQVPIGLLVVDQSPRLSGEDTNHTQTLAECMSLPPITVHRPTMRVIDGVHRLRAAQSLGRTHIAVEFFDGDENDAYVLAVRQNTAHGLPLTRAERKSAAQRIIGIRPDWSDRAIAKVTGLSPKTVGGLRPRSDLCVDIPVARVGLDGRVRPVDNRSGRERATEYLMNHPDATAREVARVTGLSPRSVRNARRSLAEQQGKHADAATEPTHAGQLADTVDLVRMLRNDPSLRFTDGGRAFLQLLGASVLWDQNAERLIDNLPPHCIRALAEAVRTCARTCRSIAEKLEAREKHITTASSEVAR